MSTPPFPYSCDRRCIRLQGRTLHPNVAWSRTVLNTSARRPSLRKNPSRDEYSNNLCADKSLAKNGLHCLEMASRRQHVIDNSDLRRWRLRKFLLYPVHLEQTFDYRTTARPGFVGAIGRGSLDNEWPDVQSLCDSPANSLHPIIMIGITHDFRSRHGHQGCILEPIWVQGLSQCFTACTNRLLFIVISRFLVLFAGLFLEISNQAVCLADLVIPTRGVLTKVVALIVGSEVRMLPNVAAINLPKTDHSNRENPICPQGPSHVLLPCP